MIVPSCIHLKHGRNEPIYETEIESQTQKIDWWLPRGRGLEEAGLDEWFVDRPDYTGNIW